MFSFLSALISPVTNIVDKMVIDKDKYAEIQLKKVEFKHNAQMALLKQTTTPNVDAAVKVLIALRDVVIPLFRPVGAIGMALFGVYCVKEGIELPEYIQVALFGAPLAYGGSRHADKMAKHKKG